MCEKLTWTIVRETELLVTEKNQDLTNISMFSASVTEILLIKF